MTRRRYQQTAQRDTRRRQETQRLGRLFAEAVRERRLSAGVTAAPVTPSPAGAGPHDGAGPSLELLAAAEGRR